MNPILFFPTEITNNILTQICPNNLITATTVSKEWQVFIQSFLKNLALSNCFPNISSSEYSSLNDRFIVSIDHHVIDRIKKFSFQIEKNQTGLFSIAFPFNPEWNFQVKMGQNLEYTDVFENADKKETLIFHKKFTSANFYPSSQVEMSYIRYKFSFSRTFWQKHVKIALVDGSPEFNIEGFHELYSELQKYFQNQKEQ
jgi:hypothetical protein